MGVLCDLCRVFIADVRVECRDEHERCVQMRLNDVVIRPDAAHAVGLERIHGVGKQTRRLQKVIDRHRQEHIELEVALRRRDADGRVVAHDLHGHHRDGLALRGIDLAGHDGRAGLVGRDDKLADAAARAGSEPAHIVCDLHEVGRQRLERAVREHHLVLACERVELVRCRQEGVSQQLGDLLRRQVAERRRGVEPGADGRAAEGQLAQRAAGLHDHIAVVAEHGAPAADLLPERERHGVLQMRAADLDHIAVLRAQAVKRCRQAADGRQDLLLERDARGHVHGRRERVIRALRAVDVVVRVHERLAQQLIGAVGNDLVDIHIRLRAAAGLPDGKREVAVERAVKDLVAGGLDGTGAAGVEHAELRIGARRRELHDRERADDLRRDLLGADAEIFKAALRLRAPVTVGRHTHLAHRIMLQTVFHPVTSFRKNLRCRYYTPICPRTATPETRKNSAVRLDGAVFYQPARRSTQRLWICPARVS